MAKAHAGVAQVDAPRIPDLSEFGARLALVRHYMRWNQTKAGRECGLGDGVWRSYEMGGEPGSYAKHQDVCQRIHDRTGFELQWLLDGTSNELFQFLPSVAA